MSGSDLEPIPLTGDKAIMADSGREAPLRSGFKMTLTLGAAGTILIAIMGLLGYVPGLRLLGSIRPDYIPMAPTTTACFLILGAALFLHGRKLRPGPGRMSLEALAALTTLFSVLNVAASLAGMELNLENWLYPNSGSLGGIPIGRMSPLTGAVFVVAGAGTLLLFRREGSRHSRYLGHWISSLGILTVLGGATVLLAYLYGSPLMYGGTGIPMAATTAIAFLSLGTALVAAAGPGSFPLRLVIGDSTSARLSRVFLPLTILVALLQGILSGWVSTRPAINQALFLAAVLLATATVTAFVVVRVAQAIGGSLDNASEKLLERQARLNKTQEMAHVGSWELDIATGRLIWSDEVYRIFGLQPQEFPATYEAFLDSIHPQDRAKVDLAYSRSIQEGADSYEIDHRVERKHSGEIRFVHEKCEHLRNASGRIVRSVGMVHDITEHKRSEQEIQQNEARLKKLVDILQHRSATIQDFLDYALEQALQLTGSKIGYIYHYHEERREFVLNTWSRDVMAECAVANPLTCYELDKTGIWGEAVRQRRPIVVNDFQAADPLKKGYPQGHVRLLKFMTVPVFREGSIVGVVGLANKETDYEETDILQVTLLMESVWKETDRKRSEEETKRQLAEKEILLKEVHHRIKNNIASIGGLLSLRLQSITNPEAIAVLQDAIGRVNSMRILYDKLLLGKGYEDISVKNYAESLTDGIVSLFPDSAKVTVEKNINDFHLDAKRLFPLGLIINELLTNKMKYAFVNRATGRIQISLIKTDGRAMLTVQDDGVGLPEGFDIDQSKGFGLMLVKMLSQQLGGSFAMEKQAGTRCVVEFDI